MYDFKYRQKYVKFIFSKHKKSVNSLDFDNYNTIKNKFNYQYKLEV